MAELERLLRDFFDPAVDQSRKPEIERILSNFRSEPESWRQAVTFFRQTENQYVQWYSLWVLEEMILKSWDYRTPLEKADLKRFLLETLSTLPKKFPGFVLNKIIKVLVDVAKHEWPVNFPELFPTIQQMTQSPELAHIGLTLLKTVCEEFTSSGNDLSAVRKDTLKKLLTEQVPGIISLLKSILDVTYEKLLTPFNVQAPMQSPSGYASPASLNTGRVRSSSLHRSLGGLLSGSVGGFEVEKFVNTSQLDPHKQQSCTLALEVLLQLFGWISLSDHVNSHLLTTVFNFAGMNDDTAVSLGVLAMSCINEMLSKSCVPREFKEYLILIFKNIFTILRDLTDESPYKIENSLETLDDNYREKLIDFINLFLSQHIKRVESAMDFPVLEFLEQLFKFTFMQPNIEAFKNCLSPWTIFLDYLHSKKIESKGLSSDPAEVERYREAMTSLLRELLKKMMFRTNGQELNEINDVAVDAEGATEWDAFVQECVELIGKLADLFPEPVLEFVYPQFVEDAKIFLALNDFLAYQNSASVDDKTKMFCALKDLRTELIIFGQLSELFCSSFESSLSSTSVLIGKFLELAGYSIISKLYLQGPQILKVIMQVFASLRAFSHWFNLFSASAATNPDRQTQLNILIVKIFDLLVGQFQQEAPEALGIVIANFLHSFTLGVRYPHLLSIPSFQTLLTTIHTPAVHLPLEVRCVVYKSLANLLVLPFPNLRDQDQGWESRGREFISLVSNLVRPLVEFQKQPAFIEQQIFLQPAVRSQVKDTFKVAGALIESVRSEGKVSKTMVHDALKEFLPLTPGFFKIYIQDNVSAEIILDFFLALFDSLRVQVGPKFTGETIEMFLALLKGNQLMLILSRDQTSGAEFVSKFLTLLKLITEEPGKTFENFTPLIIGLAINDVYPLIHNQNSEAAAHIQPAFYELVKSTLINQWKFFFPMSSVVSQAFQLGGGAQVAAQNSSNLAQFVALLGTIADSFRGSDINMFRTNLETLESLNAKRKLYQNEFFRQQVLSSFLEVLLQVLINKSHELLRDEIVIVIYNLASINFTGFFGLFLQGILEKLPDLNLQQKQQLIAELRIEQDLPSFSANILKFVADCAYFKRLNSSTGLSLS